jgi:chemotaxis protein MotB
MYAMSSVNEGKYRVLSDSLVAAFNGAPKTMEPIQVGEKQMGPGADLSINLVQKPIVEGQSRHTIAPIPTAMSMPSDSAGQSEELAGVANEVEQSMSDLIDRELVTVRRHGKWVEVEIKTDILFPSGVATLSPQAEQVLQQLAETLKPFPNAIRVEGHTDNRPISTAAFPSNWELSAARAASVVHLFTRAGMDPARLAVIGLGEVRPAQSNATAQGRNANRRVLLVILGGNNRPEGDYAGERGQESEDSATVPVALPKPASVEASLPPTATNNPVLTH